MKKTERIYIYIFLLSAFIFLLHYIVVGSGVWGDGQYYYSYLRSFVIDGNLDFSNEMEHFFRPVILTKVGMVTNKYAVGTAIFWLPFFLISHLLTLLLQVSGLKIPADGYQHLYQISTGIGAVFYGVTGLFLCQKTVEKYFPKKIAISATVFFWLSSNLFFYTAVDPINSHAVSFFTSSLLLYAFLKSKSLTIKRSVILGAIGGLLITIRLQDAIFLLPMIFAIGLKQNLTFFLLSVLFVFLPQLCVWLFLYGELQSPYLISGEQFYWLNPKIWSVFLGEGSGLFIYTPVVILSLIGLFFLRKISRNIALFGILLFIIQTYIIACWHYYTQGASYGGRMFTSLSPFFIIGLASFINKYEEYKKIIYPFLCLLVVINFYFMIKFLLINP